LLIAPILKQAKPPLQAASYRPIHLIAVLAKVFASVVEQRLQQWVPRSPEQMGFSARHGTRDNVLVAAAIFEAYKEAGLHVAFVDFKGAFDSVDRPKLKAKLAGMPIPEEVQRLIASMYSGVRAKVQGGGEWFAETVGVKQGDPLGPRLFSLFIRDLPQALHRSTSGALAEGGHQGTAEGLQAAAEAGTDPVQLAGRVIRCLLYADDLALFSTTREGLQRQLNNLAAYCDEWGLTVAVSKTEHMTVDTRKMRRRVKKLDPTTKRPQDPAVQYKGQDVPQTLHFKYVGVVFSADASYDEHYRRLLPRVRRAAYVARTRACGLAARCPLDLKCTLFRWLVYPLFSLGGDVIPVPESYAQDVNGIIIGGSLAGQQACGSGL
jgi:hypothetical protein